MTATIERVENSRASLVMLPPVMAPRNERGQLKRSPKVAAKPLLPGVNFVEKSYLVEVRKHPIVKALFDDGTLRIVASGDPIIPPGSRDRLSMLSVAKANDLVNSCTDLDQLQRWLQTEDRKAVVSVIVKQIAVAEQAMSQPAKGAG